MSSNLPRRGFIALSAIACAAALMPTVATAALTVEESRTLVDKLIGEINGVINSGRSESAMLDDFEAIFTRYADVHYIALSALGPAGKKPATDRRRRSSLPSAVIFRSSTASGSASSSAARSRSTDARPLKSFYEVVSTARLQGRGAVRSALARLRQVGKDPCSSTSSSKGVNMLASERHGSRLDARQAAWRHRQADRRHEGLSVLAAASVAAAQDAHQDVAQRLTALIPRLRRGLLHRHRTPRRHTSVRPGRRAERVFGADHRQRRR